MVKNRWFNFKFVKFLILTLSPVIANIALDDLEQQTQNNLTFNPVVFKRFVQDCITTKMLVNILLFFS